MSELERYHRKTFENICRQTDDGLIFWSARDLQSVLEYSTWQKFTAVIKKAITACRNAGVNPSDHFNHLVKMVLLGSGAEVMAKQGRKEQALLKGIKRA